ncbi:hypothetical protein Tco_0791403 [Tanacetum coccineum]
MASQDARLSKFEADFKQQQSEMANKIDTVLKAITDRMAGALPSDTVKNPKLNVNTTTSVLSARSYPTEDPQCSTHIHEDTNTIAYNEEQRDTPQLEWKDTTDIDNLGPNRDDEGIEWLDAEEPLDLVDTSEESVYESLIKEMPKCSLNYDFRIKKGDPRNLNIPCGGLILYQAYGNLYAMTGRKSHLLEDKQIPSVEVLALGWHLEEIHMTWAHLEKKQTRLRTYTKSLEDLCIQHVEMVSKA